MSRIDLPIGSTEFFRMTKPTSASSTESVRIVAMAVIFLVSLCAAGFPTAARRISFIRIPSLLFFIGKHFGTGVILSTAFVHLLSDAFSNLHGVTTLGYRNWPGAIVLGSLLIIFLIEYISTVYVESMGTTREGPTKSVDVAASHHQHGPSSSGSGSALVKSPKTIEPALPSDVECHRPHHSHSETTPLVLRRNSQRDAYFDVYMHHHDHGHFEGHCENEEELPKDAAIQLLGVLVLQLGIMLHSFVIGMTLAVTPASHLASLLTAIIFHQLFEGLSLGVRLSNLPLTIQTTSSARTRTRSIRYVPSLLTFLFAITTPIGILVGLIIAHFVESDAILVDPRVLLVGPQKIGGSGFRGTMSAISAGLLIYASCVELLAGDFVMEETMRKSGRGRQALAIASLIAGTIGMSLIK